MIRVTMFFSVEGSGFPFGFSETHWYIAGSTRESAVDPAIALYQARLNLCGRNVRGFGIRISKDGIRGDSFVLQPTAIPDRAPSSAPGPAGNADSDQPNSCVLLKAVSAADAEDQRRVKRIFLAGIPDAAIRTNPVGPDFGAVAGLTAAFAVYRSTLKNGSWGFRARTLNVTEFQVVGYTQEGGQTGRLGVQVASAVPGVAEGSVLQIRGATRHNPALPGANGQWQVHSILDPGGGLAVTYFLTGSEGVDADNVDAFGSVEVVQYAYHAYDDVFTAGQTTRKRGVGGWRRRGRSSRRRA